MSDFIKDTHRERESYFFLPAPFAQYNFVNVFLVSIIGFFNISIVIRWSPPTPPSHNLLLYWLIGHFIRQQRLFYFIEPSCCAVKTQCMMYSLLLMCVVAMTAFLFPALASSSQIMMSQSQSKSHHEPPFSRVPLQPISF